MEIFKFIFNPINENTFILADKSGDCAILDCGCYDEEEFSQLVKFIESKNLKPVFLLNTHCHFDHIFGNKFVLAKYSLKTYSGEGDEINRIRSLQHSSMFGLSMDVPPEPAGFIQDNQTITFGTTSLIALHVPGHSPGSYAFYSEKNNVVFTGDALFAGSIGRTDLLGGDYDTLINSIKTKLFVLPPLTVVYPGHGRETTVGEVLKTNPYFA
jgi:hydroxyacylglutathione hydrolase